MAVSDIAGSASLEDAGERTVARVTERLRSRILARELLPGEPVRQEDTARALGISRVPLREALRILATEGLLTHRPHQGYFVTKLNGPDHEQVGTLLDFLETELLHRARWPGPSEVDTLRRMNRDLASAWERRDLSAVNLINREFHLMIFSLAPTEIYLAEWKRMWALLEPSRLLRTGLLHSEQTIRQHENLIDALAAQDRPLALRSMAAHRQTAYLVLVDELSH